MGRYQDLINYDGHTNHLDQVILEYQHAHDPGKRRFMMRALALAAENAFQTDLSLARRYRKTPVEARPARPKLVGERRSAEAQQAARPKLVGERRSAGAQQPARSKLVRERKTGLVRRTKPA